MNRIFKGIFDYFISVGNKTKESEEYSEWIKIVDELQRKINYRFNNLDLLRESMTHVSFLRKVNPDHKVISAFERMEFLGDSILGLAVAEMLFGKYPNSREGSLSKIKSKVVCSKFLAKKARKLNLGRYILISEEEERSGGRHKSSILADAAESLICAVYLDSNMDKAKEFINNFILDGFEEDIKKSEFINYKSKLQEYTQGLYKKTPDYQLISESGPDHKKIFRVKVLIQNEIAGIGEGACKKKAQQNAAKEACLKLEI
ncbi:MAG: ribonuclease III [Candidatus Cloacimonadota bacterium]|nr:MAG: ribonuclease III [Candidatus Cloacimonadota bacterium]